MVKFAIDLWVESASWRVVFEATIRSSWYLAVGIWENNLENLTAD